MKKNETTEATELVGHHRLPASRLDEHKHVHWYLDSDWVDFMSEYVTKKQWNRLKVITVIAVGIALGTLVGVMLVLWTIWAFVDGFSS